MYFLFCDTQILNFYTEHNIQRTSEDDLEGNTKMPEKKWTIISCMKMHIRSYMRTYERGKVRVT